MNKKKNKASGSFMNWLDRKIVRDGLSEKVEELVEQIKVEQALVALRRRRGLSQAQLARRAGVSQPVIAKMESGRVKNLTLKTLARTVAAAGGKLTIDIQPTTAHPRRPAAKRGA